MNDYRITYTGESEGYQTITERSEAAAKKTFISMNKGIKLDITSIELYRENTFATKQQERETLAAIRKMVEELGPQSYLATAFEGCFEDAEQNIENDWGCSQKQLADAAAKRVVELETKVNELEAHTRSMQETIDRLQQENETLEQQLNQQTLSADDLAECSRMAAGYVEKLRRRVKAAEATILEYAEHPETTTFVDAVRERKNLTKDIEYYTALAERLGRLTTIKDAA